MIAVELQLSRSTLLMLFRTDLSVLVRGCGEVGDEVWLLLKRVPTSRIDLHTSLEPQKL
jgi:hypothetical protein